MKVKSSEHNNVFVITTGIILLLSTDYRQMTKLFICFQTQIKSEDYPHVGSKAIEPYTDNHDYPLLSCTS